MFVFFFNDTATTEIYTLSLHDALPIFAALPRVAGLALSPDGRRLAVSVQTLDPEGKKWVSALWEVDPADRKSTRLNSSHASISYAVFCLKKKNLILFNPTLT